MWSVLILLAPLVHANDVIYFDLEPSTSNEYDRIDVNISDDLESEHGHIVDRRPKFHTKSDKAKETDVNSLLRNYMTKLYKKKYDVDMESKLFDTNKTKSFTNKFLSLFHIVQFPNSQCMSTGIGGSYLGTCYHQTECTAMGGTSIGLCAEGYGACCVARYSCGASSSQNCTYFESPGYPDYDPSGTMVVPPVTMSPPSSATPDPRWRRSDSSVACSINVYKQSDDIQQMRIDFVDLELRGPTDGTCVDERLVISGQNINPQVPAICGYNTGQHALQGPLQISVLSTIPDRKRFKIRICQLAGTCTSSSNCLQYYTGTTGVVTSFNYDQAAVANRSQPGYLNNLNYAVCIRREAGYCSITYTNMPGGVEYPFQLRNVDDNGQSTVPFGQAGADIFNCPDDYIVIGGVRLCGDKLNDGILVEDFTMNSPVTDSSAGPIVIPVRTDGSVTGLGFKLFYTQNRCLN